MTLRFNLPPDAEAKLRDRASAAGLSPDEYARRVIEDAVRNGTSAGAGTLSAVEAQRRSQALAEWFASHANITSTSADDSRGNIYSGRGE
jgi:hypothetical protein